MSRYLLYIIVFLGTSGTMHAQQPSPKTIDGYRFLISQSAPDTNLIDLYYGLGLKYMSMIQAYDTGKLYGDSAKWSFTNALRLIDSIHSDHQWYQVKRMLGAVLFTMRDVAAGEKVFMEVIDRCRKKGEQERELATWELMVQKRERDDKGLEDIRYYQTRRMELYKAMGKKNEEARIELDIADLCLMSGEFDQAEKKALHALQTYQQNKYVKLFDCFYMLSVINRYRGDLDQALLYANLCVQNVDSLRDSRINASIFYGELALVYDALGFSEESAKWYKQTLEGRIRSKDNPMYIVRTAGLLIHQLVKINKAREALELVLRIEKDYAPHGKEQQAAIVQYLGHCYQAVGNFGKAEKYFLEMLRELTPSTTPEEFISMAYQDIGNFYLVTKKYTKAAQYLRKAIDPPDRYLVSRQRDIYLSLYTADSAAGNYLAAINDFRAYKRLTDSIFSERRSHQIAELQIRYQTAKKENDIILLNIENRAQENRMRKSALVRNLIIAAVLLLAGFLFYRNRLKSISNKKLEAQQRLIHQKNQALTQLVFEKEWLVKEIHHRVKNNFHMVMGLLATQSRFLKSPEAINAMRESQQRIQAMSLIHQKLYQSDNLSTISMQAYIHELVSSLRESFDIPNTIQFSFDIEPVNFDLSHAVPLGLILNEAITNSIKYAFPNGKHGNIMICLAEDQKDHWTVTVRDNGIGFVITDSLGEQGMGMKLMRGLSDDMEADMIISGEKGTTIQISFYFSTEKNILP